MMSSESTKVQVEYISEDKIIKVNGAGSERMQCYCVIDQTPASGLVCLPTQGEGGASAAPAVWGPAGHAREVVTASRATPLPK